MSNFGIALLFSLAASVWIYSKFAKRSGGGNIKPAVIGAAVVGVILFIIVFTLLSVIIKK